MSYNRRSFLKTSAAATAGFSLAGLPLFSCATAPDAAKLKYGLQLYTVRNDVAKNLATTLDYVAKAGYTQIELYGFDGKTFFGKSPKEFKAMFNDRNLVSPSGHYNFGPVLSSGNLDFWKKVIEAGNEMGNSYATIPWLDANQRGADALPKLVELVNKAAEITKAAGMKLAYHNHDFEFKKLDNGKSFLQVLLEGTDPSMVEFELDLYWSSFMNENAVEWFNKYPGRFTQWHVKDATVNTKGQKESTQVGDGSIDFTSIFAHKKTAGLRFAYVEQEAYSMPEEECIKKSIAYMKKKKWGNK
ncbi:MAG: TIM barrel protein [Lacibacter sp.]